MTTSTRRNRYGSARPSISHAKDWPDIEERREVWASLTGDESDWLLKRIQQGPLGTCAGYDPLSLSVQEPAAAAQRYRIQSRHAAAAKRLRLRRFRQDVADILERHPALQPWSLMIRERV
jgi:hypothetical protein